MNKELDRIVANSPDGLKNNPIFKELVNEITKNNPIMFEKNKQGDYKVIELLTKLEKVIPRIGQNIT